MVGVVPSAAMNRAVVVLAVEGPVAGLPVHEMPGELHHEQLTNGRSRRWFLRRIYLPRQGLPVNASSRSRT